MGSIKAGLTGMSTPLTVDFQLLIVLLWTLFISQATYRPKLTFTLARVKLCFFEHT